MGLFTAEVLVVILQRSGGGCSRRVCEYSEEVWWVDCRLKFFFLYMFIVFYIFDKKCTIDDDMFTFAMRHSRYFHRKW